MRGARSGCPVIRQLDFFGANPPLLRFIRHPGCLTNCMNRLNYFFLNFGSDFLMRRNPAIMVFATLAALLVPTGARAFLSAQDIQAADPVIVRIDGSVILQSQMRK